MCPGGWIVPAATEADGVVVNGMSLSRRDSPFANAGLVVTVAGADFGPAAAGPLAGVELQRAGGAGRLPRRRRPLPRAGAAARGFPRRPRQHLGRRVQLSARAGARRPRRRCCPTSSPRRCARACGAWARGCPASCPPTPCWSRRRRAPARRFACCATRTRCSRPRWRASIRAARARDTRAASSARRWTARASPRACSPRLTSADQRPAGRAADFAQHLAQPGALLVGDDLEPHAGGEAMVLAGARPGDARLHPQRRRVGLDVVEHEEQADGDLFAFVERPSQLRPAPPSDRSRVIAVNTDRDVRTSADMRRSRRWCWRRGASAAGSAGIV